jgi:hypothetical protein
VTTAPRQLPNPGPDAGAGTERPVLELSGPPITAAMQSLITLSEGEGGVERYVSALARKVALFQEILADGRARRMDEPAFLELCALMAPVRRRIGARLAADGFAAIRDAVAALLEDAHDTSTTDARVRAFIARFPKDRAHRWVRDLAAEVLHFTDPELYPPMCRWVWDATANTGVLREIWHAEDIDSVIIDAPDSYATFLVLREELCQFLSDNGVFRDVLLYVDLLVAQIYAAYIGVRGGAFLRADFSSPEDPMAHVRRMLGLDGVTPRSGRTRLKTVDGEARRLDDPKLLN